MSGYVPRHHPSCQTRTYPTNCHACGKRVFFFFCSCQSAVFLRIAVRSLAGAPLCRASIPRTPRARPIGLREGWKVLVSVEPHTLPGKDAQKDAVWVVTEITVRSGER